MSLANNIINKNMSSVYSKDTVSNIKKTSFVSGKNLMHMSKQ